MKYLWVLVLILIFSGCSYRAAELTQADVRKVTSMCDVNNGWRIITKDYYSVGNVNRVLHKVNFACNNGLKGTFEYEENTQ